jgi:hypothetical protein
MKSKFFPVDIMKVYRESRCVVLLQATYPWERSLLSITAARIQTLDLQAHSIVTLPTNAIPVLTNRALLSLI